jgi:hypothetical protein
MTEPLHPELLRFGRQLEAVGMVAATHADHLCVRLPLLASVRVRYDGARLTLEPRFGAVSRTTAAVSTFGSVSALIVGMTVAGIAVPALVAVGSLGALAGLYDVIRFVVTEGAVTRVTALWSLPSAAASRDVLKSGPAVPFETGVREPTRVTRSSSGS